MINVTLKRSLVTLAVTAGLLSAAGPAGAALTFNYTQVEFQGGCGSTPTLTSCAGNGPKDEPASSPASAHASQAIKLENTMVSNYLKVTMEDIIVS